MSDDHDGEQSRLRHDKRPVPGPRTRRGPRFSGAQLLGGLGLLGVLMTIAIMAMLATRVLDDVSPSVSTVLGNKSTESTPPASTVGADAAATMACKVNARTLDTAAQAFTAATGAPPANQQQIIEYGLLDEPVPNMRLTTKGQTIVVTPVGPCA